MKLFLSAGILFSSLAFADSKLAISTYTADDAGFYVNSHLIAGESDAVLVDAQFNTKNSVNLVAFLKNSKKNLLAVYITHAHPDHYFGLEYLKSKFPAVKVLASQKTIDEIRKTGEGKLKFWSTYYKDDLPKNIVLPELMSEKSFKVNGVDVETYEFVDAESESSTVFSVPSNKALLTGDLVYSGVHLWLAEGRPDGWLKSLARFQGVNFKGVEAVYPGHGKNGGRELFDANVRYIQDFLKVAAAATDDKSAAESMVKKYRYLRPDIAGYSASTLVKQAKK